MSCGGGGGGETLLSQGVNCSYPVLSVQRRAIHHVLGRGGGGGGGGEVLGGEMGSYTSCPGGNGLRYTAVLGMWRPVGGCYIYVLGEGIISIHVQGGPFIIDIISRGVHLITGTAQ